MSESHKTQTALNGKWKATNMTKLPHCSYDITCGHVDWQSPAQTWLVNTSQITIRMLTSHTDRCVEGLVGEHHAWTKYRVWDVLPPLASMLQGTCSVVCQHMTAGLSGTLAHTLTPWHVPPLANPPLTPLCSITLDERTINDHCTELKGGNRLSLHQTDPPFCHRGWPYWFSIHFGW